MTQQPLLAVRHLKMHFPVKDGVFMKTSATCKAVDDVSFDIQPGECLGLVGESGCGKSTLGKTIIRLLDPTHGEIRFAGEDLAALRQRQLKPYRRDLQMIFQDPVESLNSRHTVGNLLEEPFIIHRQGDRAQRRQKVSELLDKVGLPQNAMERFPFEFSGGQRQRIGIARAIALNPKLIICDEPVSALDVSIQSQVLNLMLDLQKELHLSYLFIAHDLAVVKHVSDRIAIMYLGKFVEFGQADDIYRHPKHPYTQALIASIPIPKPRKNIQRMPLKGDLPSPIHPPTGCPFHTRCPHVQARCKTEAPQLVNKAAPGQPQHLVACHFDIEPGDEPTPPPKHATRAA